MGEAPIVKIFFFTNIVFPTHLSHITISVLFHVQTTASGIRKRRNGAGRIILFEIFRFPIQPSKQHDPSAGLIPMCVVVNYEDTIQVCVCVCVWFVCFNYKRISSLVTLYVATLKRQTTIIIYSFFTKLIDCPEDLQFP